jgi:hypothetical protein
VLDDACAQLAPALSARVVRWRERTSTGTDRPGEARPPGATAGGLVVAVVDVPVAEPPRYAIEVCDLTGGRRLLSDDRAALEAIAALLGRRIDAIRIARERYERQAARRVCHGVRRIRGQGVRGERGRLPAEAGRQSAAARDDQSGAGARRARGIVSEQATRVGAAIDAYEATAHPPIVERIPVRHREEVLLVPVNQVASIVADGELLHITTLKNERHTITYRLKDLEARLDASRFIRLGRGTLANVEVITKVSLMPGGTHVATLSNGQKLQISRLQSRVLRDRLLKL